MFVAPCRACQILLLVAVVTSIEGFNEPAITSPSSIVTGALGVLSAFFQSEPAVKPDVKPQLHTIPLQKQYVPIQRNGTTVAYKTAYFGNIFVGSEAQAFTVVFDTGSGHLILPSISCESETCMKHRRYNRATSTSGVDISHDGTVIDEAEENHDALRIRFGTGEVLGQFVQERICMNAGGTQCASLRTVLATEMSAQPFNLFDFDGVLGLGLGALSLNDQFSFFGQMAQQNPLMQPRFSVYLAQTEGEQSAISFGGYQEQTAASPMQWVPVAKPELGYWQVWLKGVRIGGVELEDCADGGCRAILDTGTSLLGVPKGSLRTMHRMLARPVPDALASATNPLESIDCRHVEGSDLEFDLGGPVISLSTMDYSRPKPYNMTVPNQTDAWRLWCRALLLPLDMQAPVGPRIFIWGEPVLRRYLTMYDWAAKQVGFSAAGKPPEISGEQLASNIGLPPSDSLAAGAPIRASSAAGADLEGRVEK